MLRHFGLHSYFGTSLWNKKLLKNQFRQQQAEKPKVFGLSQQEVPHLNFQADMEGGSDMNPIEMRNHLRSQLKSRKGRNDDTK